jgi:hypothetical protein
MIKKKSTYPINIGIDFANNFLLRYITGIAQEISTTYENKSAETNTRVVENINCGSFYNLIIDTLKKCVL